MNLATEEEIEKVKQLDWDTYFKKYHSEESIGLSNCPKCKMILVKQPDQKEIDCYNCGEHVVF
jgi:hypothetical protein